MQKAMGAKGAWLRWVKGGTGVWRIQICKFKINQIKRAARGNEAAATPAPR